jgi:dUTP pyrophosphatase
MVVIKAHIRGKEPRYETPGAAGMDLRYNGYEPLRLNPTQRALIPTGLFIALPEGYEGQIRSRSGLALNQGLIVANAPGTIDPDYRGEIKVIIANIDSREHIINPGDRIAQLVFSKIEKAELEPVDELDETERGSGGFGSTGR